MAGEYVAIVPTPAGSLYCVHDGRRVLRSAFRESFLRALVSRAIPFAPLPEVTAAIEAYRRGQGAFFAKLIVFPEGTPHQVRVWQALIEIPAGETMTYGALAHEVFGHGSRGARAVGQAIGANPLPFFIPCHRVVAVNGLGGYGQGLTIKRKLLDFERATYGGRSTKKTSEG